MKILVVAADRMEFAGVLSHATQVRTMTSPLDWARTVELGGHHWMLAANGVGVERARIAAEAGIESFQPDAVVSTGFCGALEPGLETGDIVAGTEVIDSGKRYSALPVSSGRPFRKGSVYTNSRVVQAVEERRRLHDLGAVAVEMEAAGVARCAQDRAIPFHCVKVVTDLAGENMANDFNRALRNDGHFDTIILLQGTLRQPFARIPELLRLRSRCVRASRSLGDFFADCRF